MTIEELGKRTKAKYPQYEGISNRELGQKVLAKYPQYKSQVDKDGVAKRVFNRLADFGGKITGLFGDVTGLGGSLEAVTKIGTPEFPGIKKTAGSLGKLALTAGTLGTGTVTSLAGRTALGAATGAGFGAAEALEKGGQVGKSAAIGSVVGGGLPLVGAGLGAIGRYLTVKTPKQLVNYALKTPSKKVSPRISEAFLKRGLGGKSLEQINKTATQEVGLVEKNIEAALTTSEKKFFTNNLVNNAADISRRKTGSTLSQAALKERLAKFVPDHASLLNKTNLTAKEANTLRRAIDNNLKEAAFLGKELTNEQKTVKTFADLLRRSVKKQTGTGKLFQKQAEAITLRDLSEAALRKAETQGRPGLLDIAAAGVGGGIGGIPGAAMGLGVERMLRSPRIQGLLAKKLAQAGGLQSLVQGVSPATKLLILNLILRNSQQPTDTSTQTR